jgi:hypothetical protein
MIYILPVKTFSLSLHMFLSLKNLSMTRFRAHVSFSLSCNHLRIGSGWQGQVQAMHDNPLTSTINCLVRFLRSLSFRLWQSNKGMDAFSPSRLLQKWGPVRVLQSFHAPSPCMKMDPLSPYGVGRGNGFGAELLLVQSERGSAALPSLLTFKVSPLKPIRRYTACLASQWEDMIYVWTINQSTKEITHLTYLQTF